MLDGFNEGWIDFEHGEAGSLKGTIALETVLNALGAVQKIVQPFGRME